MTGLPTLKQGCRDRVRASLARTKYYEYSTLQSLCRVVYSVKKGTWRLLQRSTLSDRYHFQPVFVFITRPYQLYSGDRGQATLVRVIEATCWISILVRMPRCLRCIRWQVINSRVSMHQSCLFGSRFHDGSCAPCQLIISGQHLQDTPQHIARTDFGGSDKLSVR